MNYLITTNEHEPFLTEWYDHENFFNPELGMKVYDLSNSRYTDDGETWKPVEMDHL